MVRTAWLYGAHGRNFVRTMLRLAGVSGTPSTSSTTSAASPPGPRDLADRLVGLGRRPWPAPAPAGVYHGTAAGETTWFGLARAVFRLLGADPERVRPTTSEAFVRPAPRPAYSVLGHDRWAAAGLEPMRDWRCGSRTRRSLLRARETGNRGLPGR